MTISTLCIYCRRCFLTPVNDPVCVKSRKNSACGELALNMKDFASNLRGVILCIRYALDIPSKKNGENDND